MTKILDQLLAYVIYILAYSFAVFLFGLTLGFGWTVGVLGFELAEKLIQLVLTRLGA